MNYKSECKQGFPPYFYSYQIFRVLDLHGLTTPSPHSQKQEGSTYCSLNKCYTPTEFAMFGIGAIIMGVMLGVIGISWFKHQVSLVDKEYIFEEINLFYKPFS